MGNMNTYKGPRPTTALMGSQYSSFNDGGLRSMSDYSAANPYRAPVSSTVNPYAGSTSQGLYNGTSGIESGPAVTYGSNPEMFDVESTNNWWDSSTYGDQTETLKKGLYDDGSSMTQGDLLDQRYGDALQSETDLRNAQIADLGSTDWMGAASLGMQGIGTAMQMGLYGDRKDYMKNTNEALEQNMAIAQDDYDTKKATTESYGSAFSNA